MRKTIGGDVMKKVLVSLPEGIFKLIKELEGKMGESDSETIRNIVVAYLSEQGYLAKRRQ
jgi:metal-responsive CopG/Arc/MetJ family transcriptional regulator